MLVGWMVVYIVSYVCSLYDLTYLLTFDGSYPIYSFFLPVYSFWCMDEYSWGNTRVVIGEGKEKKVITNDDGRYDESMIPLKKFSGAYGSLQKSNIC